MGKIDTCLLCKLIIGSLPIYTIYTLSSHHQMHGKILLQSDGLIKWKKSGKNCAVSLSYNKIMFR